MSRAGLLLATTLAALGVGYPGLTPMPVKLVWNASASVPIGFYTIDFAGPFEVTDFVAVDAPEPLATFLAQRGYLPKGVPLTHREHAHGVMMVTGHARGEERRDAAHTRDPLERHVVLEEQEVRARHEVHDKRQQ